MDSIGKYLTILEENFIELRKIIKYKAYRKSNQRNLKNIFKKNLQDLHQIYKRNTK